MQAHNTSTLPAPAACLSRVRRRVACTVLRGVRRSNAPHLPDWWCWVFVGPDSTVFTIAPSRSLKVLTEHLGIDTDTTTGALPDALPGGRELLLSSDFYTVYQSLG